MTVFGSPEMDVLFVKIPTVENEAIQNTLDTIRQILIQIIQPNLRAIHTICTYKNAAPCNSYILDLPKYDHFRADKT